MNRRSFITVSTGALIAPFVYAVTPSMTHTIKMEAPHSLKDDMHTMWLGAIDQRTDDRSPGMIVINYRKQTVSDKHSNMYVILNKHRIYVEQLPNCLESGKIMAEYDMIEALFIAWMDTAANFDRKFTHEEMLEFRMQLNSFTIADDITHYEKLALSFDSFSPDGKRWRGCFMNEMQQCIADYIKFTGIMESFCKRSY